MPKGQQSRQREQQVERPWGENVIGCAKNRKDRCGWMAGLASKCRYIGSWGAPEPDHRERVGTGESH